MSNEGAKRRYPAEAAWAVARELVDYLAPACERIEVAGSLRRGRADVGDVELLCIPAIIKGGVNLLGPTYADALEEKLAAALASGRLAWRLNSRGRKVYGRLNKLLVHVVSDIPVDVFSTTPQNWGMAFLVRTGPKEFNIRVMKRFHDLGMRGHAYGGVADSDGPELNCPTEEEVFRLLDWQYVPPEMRR